MATVTGFTAERMLEIENASVVDGEVNIDGDLILTKFDTTQINAGNVIGPEGPTGPAGPAFDGGTVTNDIVVDRGTQKVSIGNPEATAGGQLRLENDKGSAGAVNDEAGRIAFYAPNDASAAKQMGLIRTSTLDPVATTEDAKMQLYVQRGGTAAELFGIDGVFGGPYLPNVPLFNTNGNRSFRWGAGSPEGVVTSSPGGFYLDETNGEAYRKKSGVGNTGWIPLDKRITARVNRSSNLSINNATLTAVTWNFEHEDSNNFWAVGDPTKLIPPYAGYYLCIASVQWTAHATGFREHALTIDGNSMAVHRDAPGNATAAPYYFCVVPGGFGTTNYLQLYVQQTSGGALDIIGGGGQFQSWMSMTYLGT